MNERTKSAPSSRRIQPTPWHIAWRVEPEMELSLPRSGISWERHNLYNWTHDPETRGIEPCLEGVSDAQSVISSKWASLWVSLKQLYGCGGDAVHRIQVRLLSLPLTEPKSAQYEGEKTNSAWLTRGNIPTGKSQESTPKEPQFHSRLGLVK